MDVRIGSSRWEIAFNILSIVNLSWNLLVGGILLDAGSAACSGRYDCSIRAIVFWMLGELILGPPLLASIGALVVVRGRWRYTRVGWLALALTVSLVALMWAADTLRG